MHFIKWLINRIDDPWDNFKHWLYGYHFNGKIRIKIPMKNKNYYGFEIQYIRKEKR